MIAPAPLEELLEKIRNIEVDYDYEGTYHALYNAVNTYMNDEQDFSFEEVINGSDECIIDYERAEEIAKYEFEEGGLVRIYYFLGDCNPDAEDLFYLNAYGNLSRVDKDTLKEFKQFIIDAIEEKLSESDEE